jgi:hypothetical protein
MAKNTFVLKTYGPILYKWSPTQSNIVKKQNITKKPFFCNATSGSQGQDWITNYVYTLAVSPIGEQERLAYVECDYVQ